MLEKFGRMTIRSQEALTKLRKERRDPVWECQRLDKQSEGTK